MCVFVHLLLFSGHHSMNLLPSFSLVLNSKYKDCGQKTLKLARLGKITILSLFVLIFCLVFAIVWAATRRASYSWIGQDILVSYV